MARTAPAPVGSPDPCTLAAALRVRVPGLLGQGRLHRTLRVIALANQLCPATESATWVAEADVLAELGLLDGLRALAARIERSDQASPIAVDTAKKAREKAARVAPPVANNPEVRLRTRGKLLEANAHLLQGDGNSALRLFLEAHEIGRPNACRERFASPGLLQKVVAGDIERNERQGLYVVGATLDMSATLVRDTVASPTSPDTGWGLATLPSPDAHVQATATIRGSVIANNLVFGMSVAGGLVQLEDTVFRDTQPNPDGIFGRAIGCQPSPYDATIGRIEARGTTFERNYEAGVVVHECQLVYKSVVVRDTPQSATTMSRGTSIEMHPATANPSSGEIRWSVFEGNAGVGLCIIGSNTIVERSAFRNNVLVATDGSLGDGLVVMGAIYTQGFVDVSSSAITGNARGGATAFGGVIKLSDSEVSCNGIDLAGERYNDLDYGFEDGGGNVCDCQGESVACAVLSSDLSPPEPLPGG